MTDEKLYKVSVCIPVYKVEEYIERCAVSLFEQTYENIEYVFVNDCTPDKSWEILESVVDRYPHRKSSVIFPPHDKNRGLAAVRNTAANYATGEFILWVDSDDYIETNAVKRLVEKQMETDADVVSPNYVSEYKWGSIVESQYIPHTTVDWIVSALKRKIPVHVWGRLMRRSIFINNDIRCIDGCNMGEDFQVVPRVFYYAKTIAHIKDTLYHYNCVNESSYSNTFTERQSRQVFVGVDMLKSWFADKEIIYQNALCHGEAFMLGMYMVACVRSGNKTYYKEIRKRMKNIDEQYINSIPLSYRLTYAIKSFRILSIYVYFGHLWKSKHV